MFEDTRAVLEPAGAAAVAGLKLAQREQLSDQTRIAVACGANMNFDRLPVAERRAEQQREGDSGGHLPEQPGSFKNSLFAGGQPATSPSSTTARRRAPPMCLSA